MSRKSENSAFVVDGDLDTLGGKDLYTIQRAEGRIHVIQSHCYSGVGEEEDGRRTIRRCSRHVGYLQP